MNRGNFSELRTFFFRKENFLDFFLEKRFFSNGGGEGLRGVCSLQRGFVHFKGGSKGVHSNPSNPPSYAPVST